MGCKQDTIAVLRAQLDAFESSSCSDINGVSVKENSLDACRTDVLEDDDSVSSFEDGASMSQKRIAKNEPQQKDALSKIYDLINASEKSESTIRDRLKRAKYPEGDINDAVYRAKACGLIDDSRYARVLIQSRINQGWGSKGIERELLRNNIDPETLDEWPYGYPLSDDEQFDRAMQLLERHPPRSKNAREGAYRKLVQKGYTSSIASQVARLWVESAR